MTDPILSGTPESWTRLPVQTLFSLSKSELDAQRQKFNFLLDRDRFSLK